jgi:hypothetical protein
MQVSYMRLRPDGWYRDLSERERVARMYAPQVTPGQVDNGINDFVFGARARVLHPPSAQPAVVPAAPRARPGARLS